MASPARRALAPLDANKPSPSPIHLTKSPRKNISALLPRPGLTGSPVRKRALEVEERVVKRSRVEGPPRGVAEASVARSASPDASVVDGRDTRLSDTRCLSTERERESRRRTQTRKMAGDLVARLRLAKYKVRTGQAHVPFPQLEARVPRVEVRGPSPSPAPSASRTEKNTEGNNDAVTHTNATDNADVTNNTNKNNENTNTDAKSDTDSKTDRNTKNHDVDDPEVDKENNAPRGTEEIPPAQRDVLGEDETVPCSIRGGAASGLLRLSQGSP